MTTSRRSFCELGSAAFLAQLVGCGDDASSTGTGGSTGGSSGDSGPAASTSDGESTGSPTGASASSSSDDGVDGSSSSDGGSSSSDSSSADTSSDDGTTGADLCEASPGSIEGPFYRPGIPIRSNLDLYGDVGIPVHLHGRVLDGACLPVVGAIVELWHASPVAPDRAPGVNDATYDATIEYRYYGQVATDREGRYAFDTLQPGWYLNGGAYRPAHLHIKLWADDVERLTTQLYFEDDPFNDVDPWFDATMVLVLEDDGSVERDFNI